MLLVNMFKRSTVMGAWVLIGCGLIDVTQAKPFEDPSPPAESELPDWLKKRLRDRDVPADPDVVAPPIVTPQPTTSPPELPPQEVPDPHGGVSTEGSPAVAAEVPEMPSITPFKLGKLFSVRAVPPPVDVQQIGFGVDFRISPVRAVAKAQIQNLKNDYPDLSEVIELAKEVDLELIESKSGEEIEAMFLSINGLSTEEKKAIQEVDFEASKETLLLVLEVAQDPEDAVTFSIEPFVSFSIDPLTTTLVVPLAGFVLGDDSSFEFGNLMVDLRFAHDVSEDLRWRVAYGASFFAPTGTSRSDALALNNPLEAPRWLHRYLGMEFYSAAGVDFEYLLLQADVGLSSLIGVRDGARPQNSVYFRYGFAVTATPGDIISLDLELSGGVGISDARAFDVHYFTGGLRFHLAGIQPAVGVQIPLYLPDRTVFGSYSGLDFASPAAINVLAQIHAAF